MTDNVESEPVMPNPEEVSKPKKRKAKGAEAKTEPKAEAKAEPKPRKSKAKPAKPVELADPIGDLGDGEAASITGSVAEPAAVTASEVTLSTEHAVTEEKIPPPVVESAAEPAESAVSSAANDAESREPAQSESIEEENASESEEAATRPPRKLERLQKILAQAGIASRRSAEAMITDGRVQVNGKVVTQLGSKADAAQDHIRVDGKLLHGSERLRYYVLNKPKGFVTTVKDPEGRPTVMQFFEKMAERLYPVGRLDYQTEGLLLVTNDGELANKLTKAASGVEKTYLVKVSGQPTEDQLDILRGGVSIERGKPGEGRVRTAPARIRQVRQGDNPWYEVVLIEGRNRELRKMFEEIGHFVEKIRRVGYGPLVLDQEPGKLRELDQEELAALRLAAEGKLRTPKAKELRRRNAMDAQLPTLAPRPTRLRPQTPSSDQSSAPKFTPRSAPGSTPRFTPRPTPPSRPGGYRPHASFSPRPDERPRRGSAGPGRFSTDRPDDRPAERPAWKKDDRAPHGPGRPMARPDWNREAKPGRSFSPRPGAGPRPGSPRPPTSRPAADRPAWNKPAAGARPPYNRPAPPRREPPAQAENFVAKRPSGLRIDAVEPDQAGTRGHDRPTSSRPPFNRGAGSARPPFGGGPKTDRRPSFGRPQFDKTRPDSRPGARPDRPGFAKARFDKPRFDKPVSEKPGFDRSGPERPRFDRQRPDRPGTGRTGPDRSSTGRSSTGRSGTGRSGTSRSGTSRSGSSRPFRGEGGLARPFTTSSGKPRPGGARPSTKPGNSGGRSFGAGSGSRPARAGSSAPRPGGKSSWKPKPGGPGHKPKSAGGMRSGPRGGKKRS
jgi:23S rRNA pseudouridine2605 synthase